MVALYHPYQYIQRTVTFYWPPAFLMAFLPFRRLFESKKTATLSQEWLFFVCFIVNYTFLTLFLAYFVALGLRILACAAASLATGTRNGEQET